MITRAIRPVGNPIAPPEYVNSSVIDELVEGYRVIYLNSGTAALALAIQMACKREDVKSPEVILPAYGCPDLVAAAVYAGARPVLADLGCESACYDPESVAALVGPNTVAIVAVTFLGIRPDYGILRSIIGGKNIALVEDSAQWFPRGPTHSFLGDYVVLSFGRGKPVNLLGGGALLVAENTESPSMPASTVGYSALTDMADMAMYNLLIQPPIYRIAEKLPFLGIGLTRYHTLRSIADMPIRYRRRLHPNVRLYLARTLDVQDKWRKAFCHLENSSVIDLSLTHKVPPDYALLRYPVLIDSSRRRDELYAQLRAAGLGASTMYGRALPDIEGVGPHLSNWGHVPRAREFAGRLLTLPTHNDVDDAVVRQTMDVLRN